MVRRVLAAKPRHLSRAVVRVVVAAAAAAAFVGAASLFEPDLGSAAESDGRSTDHAIPGAASPPDVHAGASEAGQAPSLGVLTGRDGAVHIVATRGGPRYRVTDSLGNVLAESLTASQVQGRFPGLRVDEMLALPLAIADVND